MYIDHGGGLDVLRARIVLHTPAHASGLNQVEVYFLIVQCKVLALNDFPHPAQIERRRRRYVIEFLGYSTKRRLDERDPP